MTTKYSWKIVFSVVLIFFSGALSAKSNAIIVKPTQPQFTIKLNANHTTGYTWSITQYDKKAISLVSHQYITSNSRLMGAPGYDEWTFKANPIFFKGAKASTITLLYARSWEPTVNSKTVVYKIIPEKKP